MERAQAHVLTHVHGGSGGAGLKSFLPLPKKRCEIVYYICQKKDFYPPPKKKKMGGGLPPPLESTLYTCIMYSYTIDSAVVIYCWWQFLKSGMAGHSLA